MTKKTSTKKKEEKKKKKKNGAGPLILALIVLAGGYLVSQSPSDSGSGDRNLSTPTVAAEAEIDVGKEIVVTGDYESPELPPACQGADIQFVGEVYTDEAGVKKYRLDPSWFPGEGLDPTWFAGVEKGTANYCIRHPRLYWGYFLRNTAFEKLEGFNIEDESSWTVRPDDSQLLQYTKLWGTKFRLSIKSEFESKYMLTYNKLWYKFMLEKLAFFIENPDSEENFVLNFPSDGDGLSYDNVDADRLKKEEKSPYDGGDNGGGGGSSDSPLPTPTAAPSGDPAKQQYAALVGEDIAEAAFVNNYDSQCYTTIITTWIDFKTNTELNSVVRALSGKDGFYFTNNTGSDTTGYVARSNKKNDGGLSACIVINGFIEVNYLEGTWQNDAILGQMMFNWEESYPNDATEIQLENGSWIHPVKFEDQPVTDYIYDVEEEIINIYDLDDYFTSENLSKLSTTDCPAAPLTGNVSITEADIIVSFDGASTAAVKYSRAACEKNGGLTFFGYDPGKGDEQTPIWGEPDIYVWPLPQEKFSIDDQPKTPFPTETGFVEWPEEGSLITIEQLIALMKATDSVSGLARCSNIEDGDIPGFPSQILVDFKIGAFTVDATNIPGLIDRTNLCHYTLPAADYVRVGIHVFTRQPTATEIEMFGPFIKWNNAWWGPYK